MDRAPDYESVGRRFEPCRAQSSFPSSMKALLIIGPPGSGKSPFGDYLEKQSAAGRRFRHFDFGRVLRELLKVQIPDGPGQPVETRAEKIEKQEPTGEEKPSAAIYFSSRELARVRQSVETATMFEEADRELVRKIVRLFLEKNGVGGDEILILNGLPRHRAQVGWLEDILQVVLVLNLDCPEDIAVRRILANLDGERQGREDDRLEVIVRRYRLYLERTGPLVDYFRQAGIPVLTLKVDRETRPEALWPQLAAWPHFSLLFSG